MQQRSPTSVIESRPLITVIVLAVGADPLLVRAVSSILDQDERADVIVVNSNDGNARELLLQNGLDVKVIESKALLFAGGARNAGIAEANTPYVAFLACDCLAAPGWIRERLKLHLAGATVVASAMMPDRPRHLISWADHLLLFPHRLPHLPQERVILFGASFARQIFDIYGTFNEKMRTGEDSEFLQRISAEHRPVWAPQVITLHKNNTKLFALLRDQYKRGYRFGIEMRRVRRSDPTALISFFMRHSIGARKFAKVGLRGTDRLWAFGSLPIVALGCLCKAAGIWSMMHLISRIDAGEYLEAETGHR